MADSGTAGGAALAAPAPGPGSGGPGPRVYFQSPPGAAGEGPGGADDEGPVRRQGKVTVKYDRKELRKRLNLEEWILEQLTRLYDCQEEEIPELEIDVDELLDMESDDARAARVKGGPSPLEVGKGELQAPTPEDSLILPPLSPARSCWLTVTNPQRPSSLACWTRSGACRS
ncbi:protein phosphatase 1 regulatory subunit 14B isoform X2 [Macaca fascicularis]|uniref:protein phosphatase 1 regulatory subunit 14B isoform X2 n=1 Tax=Macaca fascicularis TaxID=9541 RepID=UPI0032B02EBD